MTKEKQVIRKHCISCGGYFTMIQIWDCSNCRKFEFILEEKEVKK
jgi:hypothetical protein